MGKARVASRARGGRRLAVVLTLALGSSACAASDDGGAVGGPPTSDLSGVITGPGAATDNTMPSTTSPAGVVTPEAPSTGEPAGDGGESTGAAGGVTPAPAPAPSTALRMGRGITHDAIRLGISYSSDGGRVGAAVSGQPASAGVAYNGRERQQAIVDWFNEQGGIAGRKIVPVWYDHQLGSGKTTAQRQQERCVTYTEDNQVFAGIPFSTTGENEIACYAKTGTLMPLVYDSQYFDDQHLATYSNLWLVNQPSISRVARTLPGKLRAHGYFDKGAKIGVVHLDSPGPTRAFERHLKPALAALGLSVTESAAIQPISEPETLAVAEQQEQQSALRFRTRGVTHVIFLNGESNWMSYPWMRHAQQQRYFPRYALTTSAGGWHADYQGNDVTASLDRALLMGWQPASDVLQEGDPFPRTKECNDISRAAGQEVGDIQTCEFLFFLKTGLESATELTAAGFAAAIRKAGDLPSAYTYSTAFGSRRDGPNQLRMAGFDSACAKAGGEQCWKFIGPIQRW